VSENEIDIQYIAKLARIELSTEEAETFAPQLGKIVDYIRQLEEVDISSVPDTPVDPSLPTNVLREDDVRPSLAHGDAILNAPATQDGEIQMPKIVE
jgi:aspartyl-tRNA(Asn)/glutamyl-tRNA(Gln) amidotransferase subunit C